VFTADAVSVDDYEQIIGMTEESRRLVRLLGLDGSEETEARLLWVGIIALAERYDPRFISACSVSLKTFLI
jgi:hypothetical protein